MGKRKEIIVEEVFRSDKEEERKKAFSEKIAKIILEKEYPKKSRKLHLYYNIEK